MDDLRIIELYYERSELVIEATQAKYGRYCRCIADRILHDDMDAEEAVGDTYLRAWERCRRTAPNPSKSMRG